MEPLAADDPREVGGYRLIGLLGMGGMGRVFLGRADDGTVAAIKVIHPDRVMDPQYMRRFKREARAARAVSDPYIAPVVRVGVDDSPPWLATAFVPGPSLQEAVLAGPMPTAAVWSLADGLAQALQAVHAGGLVHRDLKPPNVLLSSDGPRLIDFGIAKGVTGGSASVNSSITQSGMIIGSPGFMSPEQVSGREVGPESDVFSLGAVLAFVASGRLPFGEGLPINVALRVIRGEPDLSGIISADLRRLVAGCLASDPRGRPALGRLRTMIAAGRASAPMSWSGSFWPDPLAAMVSIRESSYREYLAAGAAGAAGQSGLGYGYPSAPGYRPADSWQAVPRTIPMPPPGHGQSPWNHANESTFTMRGPGGRDGHADAGGVPAGAAPPRPGAARTVRQRSVGNPAAAELASKGDRLCARREFTQAEDAFRESIRLEPDPVVHNDLGRVLAEMGRFMEAEEQFRAAVKLAPDYIEPRQNLCRALHTMDRYHEATDTCEMVAGLGDCCGLRRRAARKGP